ncbi:hypothetical protein NX059_007033 [Plenodomus lindquistii]|nr:hypothetical protein NX059_007033 [Plenodomus lindquistii]
MVLYQANGRVVQEHEDYLEQDAANNAAKYKYEEQISIYNGKNKPTSTTDKVTLVVKEQHSRTLYHDTYGNDSAKGGAWEWLRHNNLDEKIITVDRAALIMSSSLAEEHCQYNPASTELKLPVSWPRSHAACNYANSGEQIQSDFGDRILVPGKLLVSPLDA